MSALGQKRTFALQKVMCGAVRDVRYGPEADVARLFDHLVGPVEESRRNIEP